MAQAARIFEQPDGFTAGMDDPLVRRAAAYLIERNRKLRLPVEMTVLDKRPEALAALGDRLADLGVTHAMSAPLIGALHDYIHAHAQEFNIENDMPVRIHALVANELPQRAFDEGVTEVLCIGSDAIRCAGAADVRRGLGISGEEMTSNADMVDEIFASVKGLHFWVRFELPTKQALAGLIAQANAAIAGIAANIGGSGGGALDAGQIAQMMEQLEQQGMLTPRIEALLSGLIELQQNAAAMSAPQMQELLAGMAAQIADGQASGLLPAALIDTVMQSLGEMTQHAMVREFFVENGLTGFLADPAVVSAEAQIAVLMDKLEALAGAQTDDPALAAQIDTVIEEVRAQLAEEGSNPAAVLESLGDQLVAMAVQDNAPAAFVSGIADILPDIALARQDMAGAQAQVQTINIAEGAAPAPEQIEATAPTIEQSIAAIENAAPGGEMPPPDIQAAIAAMNGVEAIAPIGAAPIPAQPAEIMADMPAQPPGLSVGQATPDGVAAAAPVTAEAATPQPDMVEVAAPAVITAATVEAANVVTPEAAPIKSSAAPAAPDSQQPVPAQALGASIAAIALAMPVSGAQIPAGDKAAAILTRQAVADIKSGMDAAGKVAPAQIGAAVQKLVDAGDRAKNPVIKEQIKQQLDNIARQSPEIKNIVESAKPAPKPACHPICQCQKTQADKPSLSQAQAEQKVKTLFNPDDIQKLGGMDKLAEAAKNIPDHYTEAEARDHIKQEKLRDLLNPSNNQPDRQAMMSAIENALFSNTANSTAADGAQATHTAFNCACGQDHGKKETAFVAEEILDDSNVMSAEEADNLDWGTAAKQAKPAAALR